MSLKRGGRSGQAPARSLVAGQGGFGSSSDFARAFRAAEGMTPRAYRESATGA